jgi:catechol 2,3-dioxygenase-like lactoylglutathione lyase family enzyme
VNAEPEFVIEGAERTSASPLDEKGLHSRLQRVLHWDVNVSDLGRARQWIESVTPLRVVAETTADQAFPSLGIRQGRFEGLMMRDATKGAALHDLSRLHMLHIVEWKAPKPVGKPYADHANVGWSRVNCFVEDSEATLRACVANGSPPFASPPAEEPNFGGPGAAPRTGGYRPFCVHDPDGVTWEFEPTSPDYGGVAQTPIFVGHNTSDVDRYLPFYTETLGLDFLGATQTRAPMKNIYSPTGGTVSFDGALFGLRGGPPSFYWLEWDGSRERARPYRVQNHLGIVRMALEVDDLDAAYRTLQRSSWAERSGVVLGPPEEWDYGPQYGRREVFNFCDPEGVFFQLHQQTHLPVALHPWGYDPFPSVRDEPELGSRQL